MSEEANYRHKAVMRVTDKLASALYSELLRESLISPRDRDISGRMRNDLYEWVDAHLPKQEGGE